MIMKSSIVIVNEKDKIIGSKDSNKINPEDIYRVSALWITNSKNQILLARRALTKHNEPGKWGPAVAGTVEVGETYRKNIIKEAEEELGLKNINPIKDTKKRIFGKHNFFCQMYTLKIDRQIKDFKIQKHEVDKIKWFSKKELAEKINSNPETFTPSMKMWIKLLC